MTLITSFKQTLLGKAPGGRGQASLPLEKPKKAASEWPLPSLL